MRHVALELGGRRLLNHLPVDFGEGMCTTRSGLTRIEVTDKPAQSYRAQRGFPSNAELGAPTWDRGPFSIDHHDRH